MIVDDTVNDQKAVIHTTTIYKKNLPAIYCHTSASIVIHCTKSMIVSLCCTLARGFQAQIAMAVADDDDDTTIDDALLFE
jgi:hypothetical protein